MKNRTNGIFPIILVCVLVTAGAIFAAVIHYWDRIEPIVTSVENKVEEELRGAEAPERQEGGVPGETEMVSENTEPSDETVYEEGAAAGNKNDSGDETENMTENVTEASMDAAGEGESETESEARKTEPVLMTPIDKYSIYTFLQGPRSWDTRTPWSGEWHSMELADSVFSIFGCGLCDLANIYSTLSPYECSPIDMYDHAVEITSYSPGGGYGAIDWTQLHRVLRKCGLTSKLAKKDKTYEAFRDRFRTSMTAIVLVSSYNDDTYWQETPGHYVNIWNYDEATDRVFLADSGNPSHNRRQVPLRYIYDALASDSRYQYLLVTDYNEEMNLWKHNGISEKWRKPTYYRSKS